MDEFHRRMEANKLLKRGVKTRDVEAAKESREDCTFKPEISSKSKELDRKILMVNTPEPKLVRDSPNTGIKPKSKPRYFQLYERASANK